MDEKLPQGKRELELNYNEAVFVELIMKGLSYREISLIMDRKISTVKDYNYRICKRCGAKSRIDLMAKITHKAIEVRSEKTKN